SYFGPVRFRQFRIFDFADAIFGDQANVREDIRFGIVTAGRRVAVGGGVEQSQSGHDDFAFVVSVQRFLAPSVEVVQDAPDGQGAGAAGAIVHAFKLRAQRVVEIDLAAVFICRKQRHD